MDPAEYKRQQLSDAKGVSAVGVFVAELAQRMPKTTMTNISLLLPHLDGEAYSLRSALVTVLGHLVCSDASSGSLTEDRDRSTSDASTPLLRAKQGFLDLLVERVHDVSAFTRARVLQTWAAMAEKKAVPLSHWLVVADLAIGRLGDKSALVRKAAMHLLAVMLGFNPFAPQLPSSAFASSLKEYEAKLAAMKPPEPAEEEEEARPETIEEGDEEKPADEEKDPDEEKDAEEDASSPPSPPRARPSWTAAWRLCARWSRRSRRRSVSPCRERRRRRALPPARALHPSDAIEATGLLVRLRQFGVDGADEGVRRMLALVFSRDTAVRDAAVEAVDVLFLAGADSPVAAAAAPTPPPPRRRRTRPRGGDQTPRRRRSRAPHRRGDPRAAGAGDGKELPDEPRAAAFTVLAMAAATHPSRRPARRPRRRCAERASGCRAVPGVCWAAVLSCASGGNGNVKS